MHILDFITFELFLLQFKIPDANESIIDALFVEIGPLFKALRGNIKYLCTLYVSH